MSACWNLAKPNSRSADSLTFNFRSFGPDRRFDHFRLEFTAAIFTRSVRRTRHLFAVYFSPVLPVVLRTGSRFSSATSLSSRDTLCACAFVTLPIAGSRAGVFSQNAPLCLPASGGGGGGTRRGRPTFPERRRGRDRVPTLRARGTRPARRTEIRVAVLAESGPRFGLVRR